MTNGKVMKIHSGNFPSGSCGVYKYPDYRVTSIYQSFPNITNVRSEFAKTSGKMANDSNATLFPAPTQGQSRCPSVEDSFSVKVSKISIYCALLILAIVGNSLITTIIVKYKNMRKTIDYFVANMACSDLLFPIFVLPRIITELILSRQRWLIDGELGLTLCKLVYFFQDVSTAVSIQSLVLIAVDRFNAVVFPLRPPLFSTKTCRVLIAATWIVALALHSPYLLSRQLQQTPAGLVCYVDWEDAFGPKSSFETYFVSLFLLLVVSPFALLAIFYSIIIVQLKRTNIRGNQLSVNERDRQRRFKQESNVLKMALAIVISFGLCKALLNLYVFLFYFVWGKRVPCNYSSFRTVAFVLFWASCAINPCVCFIFSEKYRQRLKNLLAC